MTGKSTGASAPHESATPEAIAQLMNDLNDRSRRVEGPGSALEASLLRRAALTLSALAAERDATMRRFEVAMVEKNLEIGSLRSSLAAAEKVVEASRDKGEVTR